MLAGNTVRRFFRPAHFLEFTPFRSRVAPIYSRLSESAQLLYSRLAQSAQFLYSRLARSAQFLYFYLVLAHIKEKTPASHS